jgi:hypothetical protein
MALHLLPVDGSELPAGTSRKRLADSARSALTLSAAGALLALGPERKHRRRIVCGAQTVSAAAP